ncbi:hypothetical protein EYC80_002511 [Monilinia laxa]|uniref:Uncharacterized protein n=1 Tax=Monilinia laxa TaxID=61186 RepID=A0A5N6K483_MONLA|nr:hypothetical protein EYC80_002511 [Monilinia laxa]
MAPTKLGKITAIMKPIAPEPDAPDSVETKHHPSNAMFEWLRQYLGGLRLRTWQVIKSTFCRIKNQIFCRDNDVDVHYQHAIDALKAKLVAQHATFETERKIHKDTEENSKQKIQLYEFKIKSLKREWVFRKTLADIGAQVRIRTLEQSKGRVLFGMGQRMYSNVRRKVDVDRIEKANIASHHGNSRAGFSLFMLSYKSSESKEDMELMFDIYGQLQRLTRGCFNCLGVNAITDILDLRGAMAFFFSFTGSSSSNIFDSRFTGLLNEMNVIWKGIFREKLSFTQKLQRILKPMFTEGQELFGTIKLLNHGVMVTLGTEDDQNDIDNTWEEHMNELLD